MAVADCSSVISSWAPRKNGHQPRAIQAVLRGQTLLHLQDEVQQAPGEDGGQGLHLHLLEEERYPAVYDVATPWSMSTIGT